MSKGGDNKDGGKVQWQLLPYDALEEVAKVFTAGATSGKYAPRNWEKGMAMSRNFGSLMRHLQKFWQGQDIDPEFGLHHLAHAACRVLMMLAMAQREGMEEWDDRPHRGTHLQA